MNEGKDYIRVILSASSRSFAIVAFFSALVNILLLTSPIYMLQVFDRVLVSQSSETLIYLTIVALLAILVMGLLDAIRGRMLIQISQWIERKLSPQSLAKSPGLLLSGNDYGRQCLKDINQVRQFLASPSVYALFDTPWIPFYLIVVFLLYVPLGAIATVGTILLLILAGLNVVTSRSLMAIANKQQIINQNYIDTALEKSEVIEAMGMLPNIVKKWHKKNEKILDLQGKASKRSSTILAFSKFLRMCLQLAVMGTAAYFVMRGIITPGTMIASSIIMARALAPVEMSISGWRQAATARQAYKRLKAYLNLPALRKSTVDLPQVNGKVQFQGAVFVVPKINKVVLQGIDFTVEPTESLGIAGHSGAGKSTLLRLLLGIWAPTRGSVRLDGADVYQWDRTHFGVHVGYLPQQASLFNGTVKENICRMRAIDDNAMIEAAILAGAHDMILHLDYGYDTPVSEYALSGGQMQRIALARAFYGNPKLVVLDEPEANLDQQGIQALMNALNVAKNKRMTLIFTSQRRDLVELADKILVMEQGRMRSFGVNKLKASKEHG